MLRHGDRPCGDLQARRHRRAAGAAVRRGGARIPAADGRRAGGRHQCGRPAPSSATIGRTAADPRADGLDRTADGGALGASRDWSPTMPAPSTPNDTGPDDPAMMIFTSGTTGPPKGALHGHRVLLGHLPGVQMAHEFLPQPATGCGRRPTGPGPAACSTRCCPRFISACRWSRGRFEKFDPGAGAGADGEDAGAQRLHPADRAAHAEVGDRISAAASASICAPSARPAKRSAARPMSGAARRLGLYGQRVLRPDRMQLGARLLRRARRQPRRARSASPCPAIASRSSTASGRRCRRARSAQIAVAGPTR